MNLERLTRRALLSAGLAWVMLLFGGSPWAASFAEVVDPKPHRSLARAISQA